MSKSAYLKSHYLMKTQKEPFFQRDSWRLAPFHLASTLTSFVGDNNHEAGGAEDALVEYNKSHQKIHNPFRLYDNFRKGCTNVLTAQRGLKGSNGFRNNGGHPNHHSQCYEVADAQSSLASSSIQITSIKPTNIGLCYLLYPFSLVYTHLCKIVLFPV